MSTTTQQSKYKVTGVDRYGKRFCIHTNSLMQCVGINLYKGSRWQLKEDGNGYRLFSRVCN